MRRLSRGQDVAFRDVPLPALAPLWLAGAYIVAYVFRTFPHHHWFGADAHAYWMTARSANLYGIAPGFRDAYNYSPAFAQLVHPLALLPWPVFYALWIALEGTAFAWLLAPLGWRWAVPLWCCCFLEIAFGNIFGMLTTAFVVALRYPSAWTFVLLTKITPGVGLVWHAVRREWRNLATVVITTGAIVTVSAAVAPALWLEWFHFLEANRGAGIALPVREALAVVLVAIAGLRPRFKLLLVPALILSIPFVNGWLWVTMLAAIPRVRALAPAGDPAVLRLQRPELAAQ